MTTEYLPPRENRQLAPDEIRLIEWWIQSGARFDQPLSNAPANMVPTMKKVIDVAETRRNSRVGATGGPKVTAADGGALQAVKDFGVNVLPVSKGSNALAIHCDDMASEINDDALKHIAQVGPQVVWLNLAKTRVTDTGPKLLSLSFQNFVGFILIALESVMQLSHTSAGFQS